MRQNIKNKFRTMSSIDELFENEIPKTELDLLTLINYSMECKGTLRHIMKNTKVWKRVIRRLANDS